MKKDTLLVFLILAFVYAYFYQDSGWNGNSRFGLTFAIVQEGRLTIDSFQDRPGTETGDKSLYNGHYYSDKAIGVSLLGVLFYLPLYRLHLEIGVLKWILTFCVIGLPSALAGSLLYSLFRTISGNRLQAGIAAGAAALGTMMFPYSLIFFGHQLAGALLFIAFYLVFQIRAGLARPGSGRLFLIGLLLGLALITEYTVAVIVAPLAVYTLYVLYHPNKRTAEGTTQVVTTADKNVVTTSVFSSEGTAKAVTTISPSLPHPTALDRRTLSPLPRSLAPLLLLGALLPLSLFLIYNTLCFGSPLSIGYQHLEDPYYSQAMSEGLEGIGWPKAKALYYLTVHPAMGLFWQSPVLLLAVVGLFFMFRSRNYRAEAWLAASASLALLLVNSGYFLWWGGWTFGPRHLIPMLPFLSLGLIFVPRRLFTLEGILGLVSAGQMLIPAAGQALIDDKMIQKIGNLGYFQYSTIYSTGWKLLLKGKFAPNLGGQLLGLEGWASLLPLALVLAALVGVFLLVIWKPKGNEGFSSRQIK